MGDVIPFPIVKRLPGDGLRAAMQELDQALDELNALCAIHDRQRGMVSGPRLDVPLGARREHVTALEGGALPHPT